MFEFTRKLAVVLLALALVFAAVGCGKKDAAGDGTVAGGNVPLVEEEISSFEYMDTAGGVMIRKYIGTNTDVVIPSQLDGKAVVMIDDYAFDKSKLLTSIVIPDSVVGIGRGAFLACESLVEITIPDSVTSIASSAFYGCTSLESIAMPDSVMSIDAYTFSRCTSLVEIVIPGSVKNIEYEAFEGCTLLESITIPDSVESINDYAFRYCESLSADSKQQILQINPNAKF